MKLRKYTKRKGATGKPYPQCQHVTGKKQCEKPVYADGRCWEHQAPAQADPFGTKNCAHPECGRFYDQNARRLVCRAMADDACARPSR